MGRHFHIFLALVAVISLSSQGVCAQTFGIGIVKASFGKLNAKSLLDITESLQSYCGEEAQSCSVYCSQTSFASKHQGRKSVCRVIYRCPSGDTRSAEAWRDELITMHCPDADVSRATEVDPVDLIEPPRYQAPGR